MLCGTRKQHIPYVTDGPGGVETLGTYIDAILNTVTTEYTEGIIQARQPFLSGSVPGIG